MQIASNLWLIPWIPAITLLIYTPLVCYLDVKHRDIGTHKIWLPLLAINIPVLIAGYATGIYPINILPATIGIAMVWLGIFSYLKRGADAWWLVWISLFSVVHPITGFTMTQPFLIFMFVATAATFWYVWLDNRLIRKTTGFAMENGIPFMVPISLAYIAALVI